VFFAPGRGLLFVPLFLLPGLGLFKSVLVAAVFALGAFVASTWLWTQRRKRSPALTLSSVGAAIDGLPLLGWHQFVSVRRSRAVRPELEISLATPVNATRGSPLFRILGSHSLVLNAYLLADAPEDIEDAFNHFLPRSAIS
jgi:hypothetical protein